MAGNCPPVCAYLVAGLSVRKLATAARPTRSGTCLRKAAQFGNWTERLRRINLDLTSIGRLLVPHPLRSEWSAHAVPGARPPDRPVDEERIARSTATRTTSFLYPLMPRHPLSSRLVPNRLGSSRRCGYRAAAARLHSPPELYRVVMATRRTRSHLRPGRLLRGSAGDCLTPSGTSGPEMTNDRGINDAAQLAQGLHSIADRRGREFDQISVAHVVPLGVDPAREAGENSSTGSAPAGVVARRSA